MMRTLGFLAFAASVGGNSVVLYELKERVTSGDVVQAAAESVDVTPGYSVVRDGQPVWADVDSATWHDVPEWLDGKESILPFVRIRSGKFVHFTCTAGTCELHAFAYPCTACPFASGGFAKLMADLGWKPYRCAPKVSTPSGYLHRMLGFTKTIAARADVSTVESVVFEAQGTEFVSFAVDYTPDVCSAHTEEASCISPARKGKCDWNGSTCEFNTCAGNTIGPNPDGGGDGSTPGNQCTPHCITLDLVIL